MPEISRFYGIIIYMYLNDHEPPHFHAKYGEFLGKFLIADGQLLDGQMPRTAQRLITEWLEMHRAEMLANFREAQKELPNLKKIEPLK